MNVDDDRIGPGLEYFHILPTIFDDTAESGGQRRKDSLLRFAGNHPAFDDTLVGLRNGGKWSCK